ncbi:MAG: ABC transporter ATP-binding protein/permease [Oscillospiraceae bacterium]|jgi:ATP-binding cassette subfamily B protein|nr:ABC transporter ATP-binding protein/permease [Oscillospiraceae bacterium]
MGGGPAAEMMRGEKPKDFGGTMKKLIAYLGRYKAAVLFVWVLAVASTAAMIFGPKILGRATDEMVNGLMGAITGTGGIDFGVIGGILLWTGALYVGSALLSYIQGWVMSRVTNDVTYSLRRDIDDKIHLLPLSYYDTTTHGEVLSRITNDVDTINQTLNQSLTQIITSLTSIVGIIIMMFTISWQLTLVALCVIPVSLAVVLGIVGASQKHFKNQQAYLGHVNGHVEEMYGAHVVVQSFNGQASSQAAFDEYNGSLYKSAWKANFLSGMMMPITGFIGNLGYVAVCIMGGWLAVQKLVTVGDIQAFIQYVRSFLQPISQVANISNVLQQTAAAAERVFAFLGEADEPADAPDALTAAKADVPALPGQAHIEGGVAFDHVSFGYLPDRTVIRDFSAQVAPGRKVAIVGPTGAGKTTVVKLLMRFYDVNKGSISVDGHDIRLFKRDELRNLFGMVLQDTWLFNGTIADNIRYGKLDATDEEVKAAARAAQVDHFVRTLPDGYGMVLNEEASNVSQGQKQLLTIARAILSDPDILILDEATSNVDTRTELLIQKAMDNLMRGRTSFIIAHRLSTIRGADLILVMRDGDIVEQGTHEGLLAQDGFYAELYNSQFAPADAASSAAN